MTKYVIVIPYTNKAYMKECLETLKLPPENIVLVDNTKENRGVASSWNIGIDTMKVRGADWLIVMSAAMRFGEGGGFDMVKALEELNNAYVIRFGAKGLLERTFDSKNKANNPAYPDCFYWHCTAINSKLIDQIGKFDANFHPIYFEDTDYDLRIKKVYLGYRDVITPIDAHSAGMGHGVSLGKVKADSTPAIAYFATKWGRHPSAVELGEYDSPFNDNNNSLAFWPPANGGKCDE